ncbi:MAG: hypothetical protein JW779_12630 [Candidatus Thorarchaeota archaeon]|nr:hypothetical protein [Candidatus Thorarchaeota archaeon]
MLEKILTEKFRNTLRLVFSDINNQQDRRDEEEFAKDEVRIKEKLLDTIDPYRSDIILDEDFLVAAIDGSGTDSLVVLDDIRVHLLSTSTVVLSTNTASEQFFSPIDRTRLEEELGEQPHIDAHWHSGVRGDARNKMAESLSSIYPLKDPIDLVLPFFRDYTGNKIRSFTDFAESEYMQYAEKLRGMESLITREQVLTNVLVHDELRKCSEYAATRRLLNSDIQTKYILLDGAMSVFMHFVRHYPSMPTGFMLRDLCALARQKGVILCAVSKNHTIPFAHRIAKMAKDVLGDGAKWFCHLPCKDDPGGGLHIIEERTYIPPMLAVPYLFSFSRDNRPSRIDFDRIWWLKNIFVDGDPQATRENEKALFREIEFMSRDARWYGYPVPLALAHESCKLSYEDLRLAKEIVRDVRQELGLDDRKTDSYRADYNL